MGRNGWPMYSIFHFCNSTLVQSEPRGDVVFAVATLHHAHDYRHVRLMNYNSAFLCFCQFVLPSGNATIRESLGNGES